MKELFFDIGIVFKGKNRFFQILLLVVINLSVLPSRGRQRTAVRNKYNKWAKVYPHTFS